MKMKSARIILLLIFPVFAVFAAVPIGNNALKGEAALNARLKVIKAAEAYLGTPYRYSGIGAGGIDCSGLVFAAFRDGLNISVPRSTGGLFSWAEKINRNDLRPGDLVFFATVRGSSSVSHVGIYAGNERFIHAASEGSRTGVIYSGLNEAYWKAAFLSAGRALPWDAEAEKLFSAGNLTEESAGGKNSSESSKVNRKDRYAQTGMWSASDGFFAGGSLAFTLGGVLPGAPSVFRGMAGKISAGYKGGNKSAPYLFAVEMRPEWDRDLGIFRLPFTISAGNESYQVFAGPAFTFGEPVLKTGEEYSPAFKWLGELGFSAATQPVEIKNGALSFFGEAAWQPYSVKAGQPHSFKSDLTANFRLSFGVRYLFLF